MEQIIKNLRSNPIFRMSLGSKELFHSNFLEYLWYVNQGAFIEIINDFLPEKPLVKHLDYQIGRELENYDVCIYHEERIKGKNTEDKKKVVYDLVLENKVKSIPYKEQLMDYVNKASKSPDCRFILLTLSKDFPDIGDKNVAKWTIVQYHLLWNKIKKYYLESSCCLDKDSHYIKDYCDFIAQLVKLKEIIIPKSIIQGVLFDKDTIETLKDVRLHDLYIKLRCSWFVMTLKKKLTEECHFSPVVVVHKYEEIINEHKRSGIYLNVDMNQGNGQIAAWIYDSNDKKGNTFEVVIQGNQYRHGINQRSIAETDEANKMYGIENRKFGHLNLLYSRLANTTYKRAKDFLDFKNEEGICPNKADNFRKTTGQKIQKAGPFCCYDKSYIYRHKSIDGKTVDELINMMVSDISEIYPKIPELL